MGGNAGAAAGPWRIFIIDDELWLGRTVDEACDAYTAERGGFVLGAKERQHVAKRELIGARLDKPGYAPDPFTDPDTRWSYREEISRRIADGSIKPGWFYYFDL